MRIGVRCDCAVLRPPDTVWAVFRVGDDPPSSQGKRYAVYRVEAIPHPSEAALVSLGTPVSFVARLPALAPRVPFNLLHHDRDERANRQAVTRMAIHLHPPAL